MAIRTVLALAVLSASSLACLAWRGQVARAEPWVMAVLIDASESGYASCEGLAARAVEMADRVPGSSISWFVTGDPASANEPVPVRMPEMPFASRRIMEGIEVHESRVRDYLGEIGGVCANLPAKGSSPTYLGVRRVVEHVRAVGTPGIHRVVIVESDLEETAIGPLANALHEQPGAPLSDDLPPAINGGGVTIIFCGYAETKGEVDGGARHLTPARGLGGGERVIEVWRSLVVDFDSVSFEPFCPSPWNLSAMQVD